jgi:hypothetical protein
VDFLDFFKRKVQSDTKLKCEQEASLLPVRELLISRKIAKRQFFQLFRQAFHGGTINISISFPWSVPLTETQWVPTHHALVTNVTHQKHSKNTCYFCSLFFLPGPSFHMFMCSEKMVEEEGNRSRRCSDTRLTPTNNYPDHGKISRHLIAWCSLSNPYNFLYL